MSFQLFREIQADLARVEKELSNYMDTDHPTLTAASGHLLYAGGKRLRPAFVLLAGRFHNYSFERLLPLAVTMEMIHMATLVHDDVIDESETRRGTPTVRARWGNRVSMHAGDHLFARSLLLIAEMNNPIIARVLAETSVEMCEGEIQQMATAFDVEQNFRDYLYRIKRKTALLLSASCQLGAVAVDAPPYMIRALKWYGYHLGMAFQVTDDILDLEADEAKLGKPIGSDLRQGIMTLPVLEAIAQVQDPKLKTLLAKQEKSEREVQEAIRIIKQTDAIARSHRVAQLYLAKAKAELSRLPNIPARDSMAMIADFIGRRSY
ncbi:polyprenyl synthetase family protein [Heliophilum fasciatum]|uniref:Hep2 n=1 Tax=Heliophilum fasciatum TaxID=35700 RepID=Q0Q0I4_9FIRM|nr:polyprenyl synthetase family protein [Heliophilum fasciatum]ABG57080.2 Hep2 [Heliophilum fasciatum]MCW2278463.1 heptaprenyl diphosphate synthase [Heliophilum fasciatum]TCP63594.1 heptaprenyl diphosphate synthase [Heliophilum fasciatum]